jgi:acetyltransferase-like isoleucine patch superfamily enzyme
MKSVLAQFIETIIRNISGGLGRKMRYWYYSKRFASCGKNVFIDVGVVISNPSFLHVGNNVWIDNYVLILTGAPATDRKTFKKVNKSYPYNEGELHLMDNVHVAPFVVLQAHGGLLIGANSGIASGAKLYSLSNHYRDFSNLDDHGPFYFTPLAKKENQAYISSPVVLEGGNAVGLNSVVLPGTTIPNGTWIGSNSTVQGLTYEAKAIYSNNGASFLKYK